MTILDTYLEFKEKDVDKDTDVEFKKYKEQDEDRLYDTVADGEDYPDDKPERTVMDIMPRQVTAQQKTGHPSLKTEPGGQELRLRRETMAYTVDFYLDYLDKSVTYESIYTDFVSMMLINEAPADAGIGNITAQIKKLQAAKANATDPSQIAQINAQIQQLQGQMSQAAAAAKATGAPEQPAGAPGAQTPPDPGGQATGMPGGQKPELTTGRATDDIPAAPMTPANQPTAYATARHSPKADKPTQPQGTEKDLQAAQGTPKNQDVPGSKPPDVVPQDPTLGQQVGQYVDKAKELGGQAIDKAKEVGGDIVQKGAEVGKTVGDTVAGGMQSVGQKLADPSVGGATSSAIQAVTGSPLGLAALGGAAAYGGYKLYKRFLSKSSSACKGYSGPDKTACMKSYMDAKRNQAQSRGAASGA